MTQWGSKYLADQGYSTIEILRYYYGSSMYINTADEISGVPASWPGSNLEVGSTGDKVRMLQEQLNRIARNYPALPTIAVDGIYGSATKAAVEKFQSIFGLPVTGIVDFRTWYRISELQNYINKFHNLNLFGNSFYHKSIVIMKIQCYTKFILRIYWREK